jgi:hypothetical protein
MNWRALMGLFAFALVSAFGCAQLLGVDGDAVLLTQPAVDASIDVPGPPVTDVFVPPVDANLEDVEPPPDADPDVTEPPVDAGEDAEDAKPPCDAGPDTADAQDACP